ncbi:PhoH family protein [Natronoflexus pectinivorans]|uniref:PhoH-like ATPase n=1 Tax=Natronoflexus pectinivorans TaxID=682526 RepID=A0A4R2GL31_9BACT|nr:PhoH family protein [Natronoflexus pectinivorans]TCO09655.1 PhoH-like ATPase [Natronoflexus pectinivorans]
MAAKKKQSSKIFILDTNVLLHDHKCLYNFEDNDVILPIVVLEELDKFKKGNDQINFQAREFVRIMDKLSGEKLFSDGVSLGVDKGRLFIATGKPFPQILEDSFSDRTPDHRILAIALHVAEKFEKRTVILISKDINLRMKAKSLGLKAEDYETDKVKNIEILHKGVETHDNFDASIIDQLYQKGTVPRESFPMDEEATPANQYFVLRNSSQSVLAWFDPFSNSIRRVEKHGAYGIEPRNAEQAFSLNALLNPEIRLVSLTGKAGTGKTLLALAAALQQHKMYKQILLARPIVPLSNRDLGFLPGDVNEKIGPYMLPLFDNLSVIKNRFSGQSRELAAIEEMQKREELIITPLAYIRGRSLSDVYFIVDEAQNLTPHEVKTIITRAGEGTKMIFTGDIHQIDSPYLDMQSNGLAYLTDKMKGQDLFAHVNLIKGERSYLAELASDLL